MSTATFSHFRPGTLCGMSGSFKLYAWYFKQNEHFATVSSMSWHIQSQHMLDRWLMICTRLLLDDLRGSTASCLISVELARWVDRRIAEACLPRAVRHVCPSMTGSRVGLQIWVSATHVEWTVSNTASLGRPRLPARTLRVFLLGCVRALPYRLVLHSSPPREWIRMASCPPHAPVSPARNSRWGCSAATVASYVAVGAMPSRSASSRWTREVDVRFASQYSCRVCTDGTWCTRSKSRASLSQSESNSVQRLLTHVMQTPQVGPAARDSTPLHYIYASICVYALCMYIVMYAVAYVCVHVRAYVRVWVCVCVRVLYMCVCVLVCARACVRVGARARTVGIMCI